MTLTQIETNREILYSLAKATSQDEVSQLIATHPFFKDCKWEFYGGLPNNAGIIKAQSPDPVGALVEKITNGIDALLVRACITKGINPESPEAPQNQAEAIRLFFGDGVADFSIDEKQVRNLAGKTVRIIAEGQTDNPAITVVDFGEGQHPRDFPDTFLSIGHSNRTKIYFAQGVYNQGGSAALKFCGNGYQLVVSRRAPDISNQNSDWGFTLVRERYEQGSRAEQYEYCLV